MARDRPAAARASRDAARGSRRSLIFRFRLLWAVGALLALVVGARLVVEELRTAEYQARFFAGLAGKAHFAVGAGPSPSIRFPRSAPYDDRLGYAQLPAYIDKLRSRDFEIARQARISAEMAKIVDAGFFAPYAEKTQSGLRIADRHNDSLFEERYPKRVFQHFDDIAPLLVQSLLFIENRELLDAGHPKRNPAVEWDRLAHAVLTRAGSAIAGDSRSPGGSTLATQIEKYQHSADGRTASMREKLQQMISAALRAYRQGEDTSEARRQIVLRYMNTMPLSAKAGFGEVHGLGDGLWVWYGRDFSEVNRMLKDTAAFPDTMPVLAQHYKEALSLLISQRRPSYYFDAPEAELEQLTDSHLRLLGSTGVISPALRDAALAARLSRRGGTLAAAENAFVAQKAANAVRTHLAGLLGARLYDLDRLDLNVASTLDAPVQTAVTGQLRRLRDPAAATAAGLNARQLLARGDPAKVLYSFTLYERGGDANYLRVQTDNLEQPLNINEGTKLDLGSTAKLRTLVTYLDIVAKLHQRLSGLDAVQLRVLPVERADVLTRWAAEYLVAARERNLRAMLEAALDRRYPASTAEGFLTGGGLHHFDNFNREDDGKVMSVRDGLRNSVNLVFIRLMRDIVRHYQYQTPGAAAALLQDASHPHRAAYLARFADQEGQLFLRRFLAKYQGKDALEAQALLLSQRPLTASRLAAVSRTLAPEVTLPQFVAWMQRHLPASAAVPEQKLARLYEQYAPQRMSLADRAYVAGVHPLELWLVAYLRQHPQASQAQVMQASQAERQAAYAWLHAANRKPAQDKRILGLLENEAFREIHQQWVQMGYPFDSLVPSYATALGASADRPAALAELMGILVNDGVRKPATRIESLHFAAATPYETVLQHQPGKAQRVLAPEVAQATLGVLRQVVEAGTAARLKQAFVGADGRVIPVGGKTGTGDQRFESYGAGGRLLQSRVVNRSATFVFNIDERFYGTLVAYVPGAQAAAYDFTSGLPVQLLRQLAPALMPLLDAGI